MSELPTEIERIRLETQKIEDEMFKQEKLKPSEEPPKPADIPPVEPPPKEGEPPGEEPVTEPPVEEPVEPPGHEPKKKEDFRRKYKILQGKYDQEVTQVHQKARDARDRAIVLEDEAARLRARVVELETAKPKEDIKSEQKPITLEELEKDPDIAYAKENFPDVYKAFAKMFKAVGTGSVDTALKGRVEKIEAEVKNVAENTARTSMQTFHGYLDDNVEGWREVNRDPKFKEWLSSEDRYTGKPKMALIQDAIGRLDGPAVSAFFEDFAKENTVPKEEPVVDTENIPETKPNVEPVKPKNIVPPKGKPSVPPKRPDAENTITTEHITDFYEKVRRGHYIGREDEKKAEEKKIEQAVVEGRVR